MCSEAAVIVLIVLTCVVGVAYMAWLGNRKYW